MAHEGQLMEAPDGNTLRLVRITAELLEMEATYSGEGAMPPPHFHPSQDERFEVLEGAVTVVVDGESRRHEAGEAFDVPAGTVHQMGGDGQARVRWEVRPALRTADLFEALYTGEAMKDPPAFLERYAAEFRLTTAEPPSPRG
jgi:quercetin dioxygenase-like cupin family protein